MAFGDFHRLIIGSGGLGVFMTVSFRNIRAKRQNFRRHTVHLWGEEYFLIKVEDSARFERVNREISGYLFSGQAQ